MPSNPKLKAAKPVLLAAGNPWIDQVPRRMAGFTAMTMVGLLIAPWAALTAPVRQKDALARHQALSFELERTQLERQPLDARLSLLQAQVAPHFLFNTLANVQALVDAGSPQASDALGSLIAHLRAAIPRLNDPATTLGEETRLVQAYLELMHMRMPDHLQFAMHVDEAARALRCPPMTLLPQWRASGTPRPPTHSAPSHEVAFPGAWISGARASRGSPRRPASRPTARR